MALDKTTVEWSFKTFNDLKLDEFYEVLKLRIDVFVVEQACVYPELDQHDRAPETRHVQARDIESGSLLACARIIYSEDCSKQDSQLRDDAGDVTRSGALLAQTVRIGRVVVAAESRGNGLATELMKQVIAYAEHQWQGATICLSAQTYVAKFYSNLGFKAESGEYLEDGIPHIDMVLLRD